MIATVHGLTESKEAATIFNRQWSWFVFLVDSEEYFMFNALQYYFNIFSFIDYVNFKFFI